MADADRLRRIAYLMLAPSLGRRRRLDLAASTAEACHNAADPVAALVGEVLRAAAGRTGLVMLERRGEVERELAALPPAARIAYVLTHAEGLSSERCAEVLREAEVTDPETAIALAAKSPLDPAALARQQVPRHGGPRAAVVVSVAAAAVVAGVAVPVLATGHDHATDTGVSRPLAPPPAAPAAPAAISPAVVAQLGSLLGKIDQRLNNDTDVADRQKLEKLRDAVAAKLAQLQR